MLFELREADSALLHDGRETGLTVPYSYDCGESRHNIMAQTEQR